MQNPVLGLHNPRVERVRALRTKKGRREQRRFAFEGLTLLREALAGGTTVEEIFGTERVLCSPEFTNLRISGIPVDPIEERTIRRLSDLEEPPGVIAVAKIRFHELAGIFSNPGLVLVLAALSDPGNAGTLLRAGEAFGVRGIVFGAGSVEVHSPKVVRAAMGSLFRVPLAVATPAEVGSAAPNWQVTGLSARGDPIDGLPWDGRSILVVGQERHGLSDWEAHCGRLAAIKMAGPIESLNAAVAGGIGLYEASRSIAAGAVKRV